jgi:hypothetical protein
VEVLGGTIARGGAGGRGISGELGLAPVEGGCEPVVVGLVVD